MLRGLVTYLIEHGQIETTYTRAKEVSALADKMITFAKDHTLASYRQILSYITVEETAQKLFYDIAPKFAEIHGGYTAVYKLGPRRGDGAEMALIRLTVELPTEAEEKKAKAAEKKADKKKASAK
jgi:large subunit ribosomal protein L17